jgi:proton glutamate symport protein
MKFNKLLKLESITLLSALSGVGMGFLFPAQSVQIAFLGELFLILLKMMILPLIFVSIFLAIAQQSSKGNLSQLGGYTFLYFLSTGSLAALSGMSASLLLPASGEFNFYSDQKWDASVFSTLSFEKVFLSFFTSNPFQSFAEGQILHIVVFSLILGFGALSLAPTKKQKVLEAFEIANDLVMILIRYILYYAPIGIFSLIAALIAKTDLNSLMGLSWLFTAIGVAAIFHVFFTLPFIGFVLGRFHPYRFMWNVKEVIIVALSTASSSATLPVSTRVLEVKEKVSPRSTGFVLPLGATLNMDGSALYQTLVVIFLGLLSGIDFSLSQKLLIFVFVMFSSAGTAGIPGGGLMMMGALLQMLGIPLEWIGVYVLIDRFWDPIITTINVIGDLFGAKIIDRFISINI